jgi:CRISPR-associated Cas5-like protein
MDLAMLRIEGVFHWGFWVRQAYASGRQDTLPIPPPSTLIGALASGLATVLRDFCSVGVAELKYSREFTEVPLIARLIRGGAIVEIYFKVLNGYGVKKTDITRHFQAPYIRQRNLWDRSQWYDVKPVGKIYALNTRFEISYLINLANAESVLKEMCRGINVEGLLRLSALSISRIGPVEGIVTVCRVFLDKVSPSTITYMPPAPCPYFEVKSSLLDKLRQIPEATLVEFWDWKQQDFWTSNRNARMVRPYIVPLDRNSIESGFILPFKPCTFIKEAVEAVGKGIYVDGKLYPCSSC